MTRQLNKDTTVCMSLAARPSNFGTRFHNFLYDALDLDYLYKAFTTTDLAAAIGGVRALGIRGCAISMPFKEACIPMVDELDPSAKAIDSVNTIVNTNGYLKAYNTDYIAIAKLLAEHQVSNQLTFVLRGSGGMAKAVACALKDAGFKKAVSWLVMKKPENISLVCMDLNGRQRWLVFRLICLSTSPQSAWRVGQRLKHCLLPKKQLMLLRLFLMWWHYRLKRH